MFDDVYLWFVRLFVGRRGDVVSLIFLIDLVTPFSFACIPWCSVCSRREDMWMMLHCFQFSCYWLTYWHVLLLVFLLLSKPSNIYRYCIHIDANPFSARPNHPTEIYCLFPGNLPQMPSAVPCFRWVCRAFDVVCFAEISVPKAWGSEKLIPKGKAYKKEILMKSVPVLVVKTCAYF